MIKYDKRRKEGLKMRRGEDGKMKGAWGKEHGEGRREKGARGTGQGAWVMRSISDRLVKDFAWQAGAFLFLR